MDDIYLDSIQLLAYLDGAWVDIYPDVRTGADSISAKWGINGIGKFDLLADIGELNFSLINNTGKYYPDGGAALTGWTRNVPVKLVLTYDAVTYVRFYGYVEDIKLHVGKHDNESYVSVRALDWMKFADRTPITAGTIEENKRADDAIDTIVSYISTSPQANNWQQGVYNFPVIFDGIRMRSTAYSELAKIVNSEVGHLYLRKDKTYGETLTFTNRNNDTSGALDGVVVDSDIDDVEMYYGENIVNRATAVAYPKRIDTETKTLYRLSKPLFISAGQSISYRSKYTDPDGGGARVNAIESSMITPEVPGADDPYLVALLNFSDAYTDETGLRTWTNHDSGASRIFNDIYKDGYGTTYIPGNILGRYNVFGGYTGGRLTAPSSADFNFGSGAFTVSWYENRINGIQDRATMARDATNYPAFMFGRLKEKKYMRIYMSSGGSLFDIADGKSMGEVQIGRWTHYEISRDEDGWFYSFADGKLQDSWYSSLALRSSADNFTIGRTKLGYTFFGFDAFAMWKGICKHKTDFEPPKRNPSPTLEGDYLLNTAEDGSGDDISAALTVTATYGSEAVAYDLTNTGAADGYIIHQTARGRGVYAFNSIEKSVEDSTSINNYGYKEEKLDMPYQQDLDAGTAIVTELVGQEKDPRTELRGISFVANRNDDTMSNFLNLDVRDLVNIVHASSGIDNFYRINNISFDISAGGKFIKYKWGLCPMLAVDDIVITPIDPTFKGVLGIQDITQSQTIEETTLTQDYLLDIEITIEDIEQSQTIEFNLPEMSVYLISSNVTGLGDVIGDTVPSGAGNIPIYSDTSGKHIEDSGITYSTDVTTFKKLETPAAASSNDNGIHFVIEGGNGDGSGGGGTAQFAGGSGGATGSGGFGIFEGGSGGATSGVGGSVIVQAGTGGGTSSTGGQAELNGGVGGAPNGDGGDAIVKAGSSTGGGAHGELILKFGDVGLKIEDEINATEAHITIPSLSAARTYELPDASGFIQLGQVARCGTQFDKTSNTTLGTVTDLTINIDYTGTYKFKAVLYTTSNVAGGVKAAINQSGLTLSAIRYEGVTIDAGVITQSRATAAGSAVGAVTAVTAALITIEGTMVVTAVTGSVSVEFAQNASNGTASSVLVGSSFEVTLVT
jgi:hypothetical protein